MTDIDGVVLAGGRARRFNEQDKGLLLLAGEPLVAHAVRCLREKTDGVMIVANRHREAYQHFGCSVIGDVIKGFAGPLAGIHAAMTATSRQWVLSVPCDSPFLPSDLATRLSAAAASAKADVAVAVAAGRAQPVCMLARAALRDDLAQFMAAGDGKISRWYERLSYAEAEFSDAAAFDNINTPEDLAAAQARLARSG